MEKEYYKEYFINERKHWWYRVREEIIKEVLTKQINNHFTDKKKIKILNVGCATGRTTQFLKSFGDVVSLEYDLDCINFLYHKTGIQAIHGSVLNLPFENSTFDIVCAFDVIEHVFDDKKAFLEMRRVLNIDGIILITVPAFNFMWSEHDVINHHFRRYTKKDLKKIIQFNKNSKIFYFNSILSIPIMVYRILFRYKINNDNHKSDFNKFNNFILDFIFTIVFKIDLFLIKISIYPIFGSSIFAIFKNK